MTKLKVALSVLAVASAFASAAHAAGPPDGLNVNVTNTPLPVQGSVSITVPGQPFSHTFTTTSPIPGFVGIDCVADLPAGTAWSINHFSIANGSASIDAFFRLALLNSSQQIETVGPRIHAGPGETVQLNFSQPYILSSPGSGMCLVADTATDVYVTVVGFRQ